MYVWYSAVVPNLGVCGDILRGLQTPAFPSTSPCSHERAEGGDVLNKVSSSALSRRDAEGRGGKSREGLLQCVVALCRKLNGSC